MCIVVSRHGTWMDGRVGRARGGYLSGGCKALYDKRILAISAFAKRQTFVLRFEPGKKKSIWTLSYVNDRSKELSLAYFHDVIISFRQPIMYLWKLGKGLFCVCSGYGEFHTQKRNAIYQQGIFIWRLFVNAYIFAFCQFFLVKLSRIFVRLLFVIAFLALMGIERQRNECSLYALNSLHIAYGWWLLWTRLTAMEWVKSVERWRLTVLKLQMHWTCKKVELTNFVWNRSLYAHPFATTIKNTNKTAVQTDSHTRRHSINIIVIVVPLKSIYGNESTHYHSFGRHIYWHILIKFISGHELVIRQTTYLPFLICSKNYSEACHTSLLAASVHSPLSACLLYIRIYLLCRFHCCIFFFASHHIGHCVEQERIQKKNTEYTAVECV